MAHKEYDKPLLDKLGVKPGARVSVIDVEDSTFQSHLRQRLDGTNGLNLKKDSDLVFYGADSKTQLSRLKSLRNYLTPNGAIWVVSLKGKLAKIKDVDVITAAKSAGLVDNKVVSFSENHTALRLVIPLKDRSG